jgi:hypothetical protein
MHAFVIPGATLEPQSIETLPETPPTVLGDDGRQCGNHGGIGARGRYRRPVVRRPRQPHYPTGSLHGQLMLVHQDLEHLSFR